MGKSTPRIEDNRLSKGQGTFVDDLKPLGTIYCAILRSPYAHAKLVEIDTRAASDRPEVLAVLSGEDVKKMSDPAPPYLGAPVLHYCMAVDKVRFVGEPVAAVAATNRYAASDALESIKVEYSPLASVMDPLEAMSESAPILFEELRTNLVWNKTFEFGNVDEAFKNADITFHQELRTHRYTSSPLETFACTSWYHPGTQVLEITSNTQQAGIMLKYLCKSLRLKGNRVRMKVPQDVGGGFGIKCGGLPYIAITSLLSMMTERPVSFFETRSEHLTAQGHQADSIFLVEAAAKQSGELTGLKIKDVIGEGGNLTWASIHNVGKLAGINGNYLIKNISYEGYAVATNKAPAVPNRGIGKKGMNYIIERTLDRLADELSISRVEIRKRNFIRKDLFPYATPSGQLYDNSDYSMLLSKVLEISAYEQFKKSDQPNALRNGRYLGIGIACGIEPGTVNFSYHSTGESKPLRSGSAEGAKVKVESTGRVNVLVGSVSNGQGHETAIAQVVSDELGIDISEVNVVGEFDTFVNPWTVSSGVYSNKFSSLDLGAVISAARKVKKKMMMVASRQLQTEERNIVAENGIFYDRMKPEQSTTFEDVADTAYNNLLFLPPGVEPGLEATCFYSFPDADISSAKGKVRSFLTFASSAHAAKVEVDVETGKVNVLGYYIADDCGNMINPMIVEGQIHGNVAAEVSAALMEEIVYDQEGQILTSTFMDYLKPTSMEMVNVESEFVPTPSPFTILGTKSVGDGPAIPVISTMVSAVEDALSPFNIRVKSIPITPEKVLGWIEEARMNKMLSRV
ncbi:MAG: xanthine dehydrogenase family protein molybdopterin-binding subunit [Nitrososphaerales archaeon]